MLAGKYQSGFSIIELLIAMALLMTVISGALAANMSAQYWRLSAVTAYEANSKASEKLVELKVLARADFDAVTSTEAVVSKKTDEESDRSCLTGGLCYSLKTTVKDISSCVKNISQSVFWKLAVTYPTSSVTQSTIITNPSNLIALGSDCTISDLSPNWLTFAPNLIDQVTHLPQVVSGVDVVGDHVYAIASSAPQLRILQLQISDTSTLEQLSSSTVTGNRLNAVDVIRDMATGRLYAYVVQHTNTEQLVVLDVTDENTPVVVTTKTLSGVSGSSFPQGWRVFAFGDRLYVCTRETAGPELHIFSLVDYRNPVELLSGNFNLNRTVNDMIVLERKVGTSTRRLLVLAASAALKELAIIDVTDDAPRELVSINLSGSEDAASLSVVGNTVYVGRKNTSGPELLAFSLERILVGSTTPQAISEVGSDVLSLKAIGDVLLVGTSKSGAEFQVWKTDTKFWSPILVNAARVSFRSVPRLAPLGIDVQANKVYIISQSATQPESLSVITSL